MFNAKDILQDMTFVTMVEKQEKQAQCCPRKEEILLQHTIGVNYTVPYKVIDNPTKLTSYEWSLGAFHLRYSETKLDSITLHIGL
ncbi:hypothetical protein HA402_015656 [Bradysia odoriphaga]|nr:hypothetical protein HA402_015656 [Bradysia odoriphaga]